MDFLRGWILTGLIALPLIAAVAVGLLRTENDTDSDRRRVSRAAFAWSICVLILSVVTVVLFYRSPGEGGRAAWAWGDQVLSQNVPWVGDPEGPSVRQASRYVDLRYHVAVDGLSSASWSISRRFFSPPEKPSVR